MRTRPFTLLLALLVLVTSCQVSGAVAIDVAADGSGTVTVSVTLDDEAQARVGDLASELQLDDLRASGWTITDPSHADGEWVVTGTKPFGSPDGLQQVLDEVGGREGLFRDWTIEIASGFASTEWKVAGRFVFSGSMDQFSDAELTQALDGLALGRTPEELAAELGEGGAIPLTVEVKVPVEIETTSPDATASVDDTTAAWTYDVAPERAYDDSVSVTAVESDSEVYVWFGLAGLCLVLAAIVVVIGGMRRRSGPLNRPG